METVKNIFIGIGVILALSLGPSLLFLFAEIMCFIFPAYYLIKFLYRIFTDGSPMVKLLVVVGLGFGIDYAVNHYQEVLAVWFLVAIACFACGIIASGMDRR